MAGSSGMTPELRLRLVSAAVLIAVTGLALWLGGWTLRLFVALAGLVLISEYWGLVRRITRSGGNRLLWMICGIVYVVLACVALIALPPVTRLIVIGAVIAVDSGAYFAGRAIGGPKIAPAISPSKTWAGLGGGIAGAAAVLIAALPPFDPDGNLLMRIVLGLLLGAAVAVLAQTGDFLESWIKRRAGAKDSGTIIPGHGGLLDRVDGLMPVAIAAGFVSGAGWL